MKVVNDCLNQARSAVDTANGNLATLHVRGDNDFLATFGDELRDLMSDCEVLMRRIDRLHHDAYTDYNAAQVEAADRAMGS